MDGDDIEVMPSLKHEDTDKAEAIWLKWMLWGNRMGCHQKPERSFFYKGYQFPVCARCTGVLFASVAACVMFPIYPLGQGWCVGMCLVMFLDWFIQRIGVKESTNTRRLLTGLAGGYGVMTLQLYMYRAVVDGNTYEDFVLPNSDSEYLAWSELENLSAEECRIARNEIYARHGRKFDDEQLQEYFEGCSWYEGTIDPEDFSDEVLSEIEKANLKLIVEYEEEMGY